MKKPNVIAIIQARMGSVRFPNKTTAKILGKTMLERIVERVRASRSVDRIVIATSTSKNDDAIERLAKRIGVPIFRGSEQDVIDRIHQTVEGSGADVVVRVTADNPLVDPGLIDAMVEELRKKKLDFLGNSDPPTFPHGLNLDVFTAASMEKLWKGTRDPKYHDTFRDFIFQNPARFRIGNYDCKINGRKTDISGHRWTVDYPVDLEKVRHIYKHLYPKKRIFRMRDILALEKAWNKKGACKLCTTRI